MLDSAQTVDAMAPSPTSKFFVGVASFSIAADMVTQLQDQAKAAQKSNKKPDKDAACTDRQDHGRPHLTTTARSTMPDGASVSKETAGQIMARLHQLGDFISQIKKAFLQVTRRAIARRLEK